MLPDETHDVAVRVAHVDGGAAPAERRGRRRPSRGVRLAAAAAAVQHAVTRGRSLLPAILYLQERDERCAWVGERCACVSRHSVGSIHWPSQ